MRIKTVVIPVRLRPSERDYCLHLAREAGLTLSEWIRERLGCTRRVNAEPTMSQASVVKVLESGEKVRVARRKLCPTCKRAGAKSYCRECAKLN
jgi:hypothetical protein